MALWNKLKEDNEVMCQLLRFYSSREEFPFEVREIFAEIIEEAVCGVDIKEPFSLSNGLNPDCPEDNKKITTFLTKLVEDLESQIANTKAFQFLSVVWKLRQILSPLKEKATKTPIELFKTIRGLIQFEIVLLEQQKAAQRSSSPKIIRILDPKSIQDPLTLHLNIIASKIEAVTGKLRQFKEQNKSSFYKPYLPSLLRDYEQTVSSVVNELSSIIRRFLDERISIWKLQQQHLCIGITHPKPISLEDIQSHTEQIYLLLLALLKELQEAESESSSLFPPTSPTQGTNPLSTSILSQTVIKIIETFVRETFLITKQPPLVIKQCLQLTEPIAACLLVGKGLLPIKDASVTLSIITETQAKQLFLFGSKFIEELKGNSKGGFGNRGVFEKGSDTAQAILDMEKSNRVVVNFDKVKLMARVRENGRKRGGGGGDQPGSNWQFVMEEKFCLVVSMTVDLMGTTFKTWATSHPLTVSTHKSQNPHGAATIVWDYATAKINRVPFEVAETMSWSMLSHVLNSLVEKCCGKGLTDAHLNYLKQKLFNGYTEVPANGEITWSEFTKRKFIIHKGNSERGFSFWDWYYLALGQLEGKSLKSLWQLGFIFGFCSRTEAETALKSKPKGTFLIRFADSLPAAITISYVWDEGKVISIQPFLLREFHTTLPNFIRDLPDLKYIYSRNPTLLLPKDAAFKELYTNPILKDPKEPEYVPLTLMPKKVPTTAL